MSLTLRTLCVLTPLVMAVTGFQSSLLADWWLENLVVFALLLGLALSHQRLQLSNLSYLMLFVFLCAHEYGAAYHYVETPLGEWAKPWINTERNHYDRLIHLLFGLLLTLPVCEAFRAGARVPARLAVVLSVQSILAASAIYEILEWIVASGVDAPLGLEFVGAQGDGWDAPKDMLLALLGSVFAAGIVAASPRWRNLD